MSYQADPAKNEVKTLHAAANLEGARVIEIGSGNGRLLKRYAESASTVIGIDPNLKSINDARESCSADVLENVEMVQSRSEALPFASDAFDVALLGWAL